MTGEAGKRSDEGHEVDRQSREQSRRCGGIPAAHQAYGSRRAAVRSDRTGSGAQEQLRSLAQITRLDAATAQRQPADTEGHNCHYFGWHCEAACQLSLTATGVCEVGETDGGHAGG